MSETFRALGSSETRYLYDEPSPQLLERFPNPTTDAALNPAGATMALRIVAPEFTCLCPITSQPDFATIVVRYQPDQWCVESKSLKLYLGSFRNAGVFHEAAVTRICNELVALLEPLWLVVEGRFTPRGGIPFWPLAVYRRSGDFDLLAGMTERMGESP